MRGRAHRLAADIALVRQVHQQQQDGTDMGIVLSRVVLVAAVQQVQSGGHEGAVGRFGFGQQLSVGS